MDSTHALILWPPLISRFFKTLLLGMEMYPPGAAGGFCVVEKTVKETPDLVSDTTTFCCVILTQSNCKNKTNNNNTHVCFQKGMVWYWLIIKTKSE